MTKSDNVVGSQMYTESTSGLLKSPTTNSIHRIYPQTISSGIYCTNAMAVPNLLLPNFAGAEFVILNPTRAGLVTLLKYHKERTVKHYLAFFSETYFYK